MPTKREINRNVAKPIPSGFITPKSLGNKKPIMYTASGASIPSTSPVSSAATSNTPPTPSPTNPSVSSTGSLSGGLSYSEAVPEKTGSLADFQKVMRAISQDAYESRAKAEGKITEKQFDRTKVSGSIFRSIMDNLEGNRGQDISKIYSGAVEAAEFDLKQKEEQRQFNIQQDNKKFDTIKQKLSLGIDSVYIPAGTLADKNNNPGNLKFVGQVGATMGESGFAKFESPEAGYQALINQVRLDQMRGLTLEQFIAKYAPPTENDTQLYIQQMSQWLGVNSGDMLSSIDQNLLAQAIAKKESGTQFISSKDSGVTSQESMNYAQMLKDGTVTVAAIPEEKRAEAVAAYAQIKNKPSEKEASTLLENASLVDEILKDGNYKAISGWMQTGVIPGTKGVTTKNQYDQLKGLLALDKRQLLKGSGAVSDYESRVLDKAASSISRAQSEEEFKQQLIKIRGVFRTSAGLETKVKICKGSNCKTGTLGKLDINDALAQGYSVDYIE